MASEKSVSEQSASEKAQQSLQTGLPLTAPGARSDPASFEGALSELEGLVQSLEGGKLSLESAIAGYQRGTELIRYCQTTLNSAEQKIQVLEAGLLQDFESAEPATGNTPPRD